eukprot:4516-Heterococcus_DN1.PRE.1
MPRTSAVSPPACVLERTSSEHRGHCVVSGTRGRDALAAAALLLAVRLARRWPASAAAAAAS